MSYIRSMGADVDLSKIGAGTPLAGEPTMVLIATVNRFLGVNKFPLATGKVSLDVAIIALTLLQQSLITAAAAIPDPGTTAQLNAVNAAFADPVAYVTANQASVTAKLAGYADSKGLPPANMNPGASSDLTTALAIGGVLLVAWMALRK